jgi:hypothetical protein
MDAKFASKTNLDDFVIAEDEPIYKQAKFLVFYWTDIQRRTFYVLNRSLADRLISQLYLAQENGDTKIGRTAIGKPGNPVYRNPNGRFTKTDKPDFDLITETTTKTTTEIFSPAGTDAQEQGDDDTTNHSGAVAVETTFASDEPGALYNELPPDMPLVKVHQALLAVTTREEWFGQKKRTKPNSVNNSQIVVNDQGLTQAKRDEMEAILAEIHQYNLLLKADNPVDKEWLCLYAEEFFRIGFDAEKLRALGELWKAEKSTWGPPISRQLIKFASQVNARNGLGKEKESNNAKRNKGGGAGGSSVASPHDHSYAEYERLHGEITQYTVIPSSIWKQWPSADQDRYLSLTDIYQSVPMLFEGDEDESTISN